MKIILTQTGGLMGRTKTAEADRPWTEGQFKKLVEKIKAKKADRSKDGYSYFLKTGDTGKEVPVSITAVGEEHQPLFDELFRNLRISG